MSGSLMAGSTVTTWRVSEVDQLQRILDGLSNAASGGNQSSFRGGAEIILQKGRWESDITLNYPYTTIRGEGLGTEIIGKVTVYAQNCGVNNACIRGTGKQYALRIGYNPDPGYGFVSRCNFENLDIGASSQGAGDGPVNGIEIDGSWIDTFRHVTSSNCTGTGLLVNSTGANPNTTLRFEACTFNKNGTYGVNFQDSLNIIEFMGGNMEDNVLGEVLGANSTNVSFRNVFFERANPATDMVSIGGCQPVMIEGCFFSCGVGVAVTRAFAISSCAAATVRGNRFSGFTNPGGPIGFIDQNSIDCSHYDNTFQDAGAHIVNRSRRSATSGRQ